MKQLILFISLLVVVWSCQKTQVTDIVLQAEVGPSFFRSLDARVTENEDGTYLIQGITNEAVLNMKIENLERRTYGFGGISANYASFENLNGDTYVTNPLGEGSVSISHYDEEAKTASGSFEFKAVLVGVDTIAVQNGLFYQARVISLQDDNVIIEPNGNAGIFVCAVNGAIYNPYNVSAIKSDSFIEVNGYTGIKSVTITLPVEVEPGSYSLPRVGFSAYYQDGVGLQESTDGNVIVFSHDLGEKKLKGTFSFLTEDKVISLGQFNVNYQ